jgi:hypothetical protein
VFSEPGDVLWRDAMQLAFVPDVAVRASHPEFALGLFEELPAQHLERRAVTVAVSLRGLCTNQGAESSHHQTNCGFLDVNVHFSPFDNRDFPNCPDEFNHSLIIVNCHLKPFLTEFQSK